MRPRPPAQTTRASAKRTAGTVGAALVIVAGILAVPAWAAAKPHAHAARCFTVHVGPRVKRGQTASYFRVTAAAGGVRHEAVLIANPQPVRCRVTLYAAYGKTATNSGDTYPVVAHGARCRGTSCWVRGLPARVTVPAHARIVVRFAVHVPAHTAGGEYLAGVVVRPDVARGKGAGKHPAQVGAVVVTGVGIGVAVRVAGPLHPRLTIPAVTLLVSGGTPRLQIVEHDSGNSWEHPAGGAVIRTRGGSASRFGVESSTVLPGDSATLTLPVSGTAKGTHPTEVILWYAHRTRKAVWRGVLTYPASTAPITTPTAAPARPRTKRVVIATSHVPTWVVALAAGLGATVLVLGLLLLIILRRRRRDDETGSGRDGRTMPRPDESVGSHV